MHKIGRNAEDGVPYSKILPFPHHDARANTVRPYRTIFYFIVGMTFGRPHKIAAQPLNSEFKDFIGGIFMILEKLIALICEALDIEGVEESTSIGSLVDDDFELKELVQAVESEFEVEFGEEIGDITVSELADMIEDSSAES